MPVSSVVVLQNELETPVPESSEQPNVPVVMSYIRASSAAVQLTAMFWNRYSTLSTVVLAWSLSSCEMVLVPPVVTSRSIVPVPLMVRTSVSVAKVN